MALVDKNGKIVKDRNGDNVVDVLDQNIQNSDYNTSKDSKKPSVEYRTTEQRREKADKKSVENSGIEKKNSEKQKKPSYQYSDYTNYTKEEYDAGPSADDFVGSLKERGASVQDVINKFGGWFGTLNENQIKALQKHYGGQFNQIWSQSSYNPAIQKKNEYDKEVSKKREAERKEKEEKDKDREYLNLVNNLPDFQKAEYQKAKETGGTESARQYLDLIKELNNASNFSEELKVQNKIKAFMKDINKKNFNNSVMSMDEMREEAKALSNPDSEQSKAVSEAQRFINQTDFSDYDGALEQSIKYGMNSALQEAGNDPAAISPSAYQDLWKKYGKEEDFLKMLKAFHPTWTDEQIKEEIAYLEGKGEAPDYAAAAEAGKSNFIDILNMSNEQYQDDSIWGDQYGGKAPTAWDVAAAAKAKGWNKAQCKSYFKDKLGGLTTNAKKAIEDIFDKDVDVPAKEPFDESKANGAKDTNVPNKTYTSGGGNNTSGSGAKVPTETIKVDSPKEVGELSDKEVDNMWKQNIEKLKESDRRKKEIEEQLKDPNLTEAERLDLESQLKTITDAQNLLKGMLTTNEGEIASHAKEREQFAKYINKSYSKNLIPAWVEDSQKFKKQLKTLEDDLAKAKESGDTAKVKELEAEIAKTKEDRKDMHQEYGMFLINALGTALSNMGAAAQGQQGNQESLYQQRQKSNIETETKRWNDYKDESLKQLSSDIDRRWGEHSDIKNTYNQILADERSKSLASRYKIIDKANDVQAINEMKKFFGNDIPSTIETMALLGYGAEEQIITAIAKSGVDIDGLLKSLSEAAQNGVDFAASAIENLNSLFGKLNSFFGGGE